MVVDSTEKKRKKKRRQSEMPPVEELPILEVAVVDSTPGEKRKKKKKRDSELLPVEEPAVLEELPIQEVAVVNSTSGEKRKKKKKRNSELPLFEEPVILEEPAQEDEAIVEPPTERKRKKRRSQLPPVEEFAIPEEPVVAKEPTQDDTIVEPATELKQKRKKKRRSEPSPSEALLITAEPTQEDEAVIEPAIERKKKKSKRQSEVQLDEDTLIHDMLILQAVLHAPQIEEAVVDASPERKRKKKKRHSTVEEAQQVEEPAEPEPAVVEVLPELHKKKKKSKRPSAVAEVQLRQESPVVAPQEEEPILQVPSERKSKKKRQSQVLDAEQSGVEPSSKPERQKKKQLAESDERPIDVDVAPEDTPASPYASKSSKKKRDRADDLDVAPEDTSASPYASKSAKKKRDRTEDLGRMPVTSTKKRRKHASPPEAVELEFQYGDGSSLLASHLSGDTNVVARLWEQRYEAQETIPATLSASAADGDYLWPPVEREISPELAGESGPPRRREESIETASEAEDYGLPVSGDPQVDDDPMHVDSSPHMPSFTNDDIESVASFEEGRPLGNRAPSIESDSDRVPDSPSPWPANSASFDGPEDAADIEMHDAEPTFDAESQPGEQEITATPYPEPETASTTASSHSRPPSRHETETPPQESEDGHRQVSPPTTQDSQPEFDGDNGQPDEEVAQSPSPEPVLSARARGKRPVRNSTQEPERLQNPEDEAQQAPRPATRSGRATDVDDGGKDDTPAAASSPASKSLKTPKSRMVTRRKPKTPFFDQGKDAAVEEKDAEAKKEKEEVANAEAFAELPASEVAEPSNSRPKRTKKKTVPTAPKGSNNIILPNGMIKGPSTAAEDQALITTVENFRQTENLTEKQLFDVVHVPKNDWPKGDARRDLYDRLGSSMKEAVPNRDSQWIRGQAKRHFNNFVKGWTPAQEVELRELVKKYPNPTGTTGQWPKIASILNRAPGDCSEHWKNKVSILPTRKLFAWIEDEEQRMYDAVHEAVTKIKASGKISDLSTHTVRKVVNWQDISWNGMGKTRERLQCLKKWNGFVKRGLFSNDIATVLAKPGTAWRLEAIKKDLEKIGEEEKYKMVKVIANSKALVDSEVNWRPIVVTILRNHFQRRAVIMTWKYLRMAVPGEKDMSSWACAQYIRDKYEKEKVFVEAERGEDDVLLPEFFIQEVPPKEADEIDSGGEDGDESDSDAEDEGASAGGAAKTKKTPARSRVKPEPGEPSNSKLASIPEKPKPAAKKATAKKPPAKKPVAKKPAAKRPSASAKASTSASTAGKTPRSEEFAHDTDTGEDEVAESIQEDEAPESIQEYEVPESIQGDDDNVTAPPRDPSIDLAISVPRRASAPTPRTYGKGRTKKVAKRTVVVEDSDNDDEEAPSSPVKRTRAATRRKSTATAVVVVDSDDEDVEPPVSVKKAGKRKREEEEDQKAGQKRARTASEMVSGWEAPVGVPLRAASVLSSDMDDMEDIQATL
ncbi:hypothetical protein QBC39DRAFT_356829 [Podospora conica]|nr:hypothetical protein QBC39DRAFT_356829 [Schizothecium conicum]